MQTAKAWLWTALGAALLAGTARGDPSSATAAQLANSMPAPPLVRVAGSSPAPPSPARAPAEVDADVPSLAETQAAASRLAAGDASEDASRLSRARGAHWAPVVRGQLGGNASEHTRDGVMYQDPLHWTDVGDATTWAVTLTWDLPSAIYARDENQLALSLVHLARVRREVSARVALLYAERKRRLLALYAQRLGPAETQLECALALLETTAELDALTGGLFRPALAAVQSRADVLSHSLHLEALP